MPSRSGFNVFTRFLSGREFGIRDGVMFVIGISLLGFMLPWISIIYTQYLLAGLVAGFALASPIEGFISSAIGGTLLAVVWFVLLLSAGTAGVGIVTALLVWCNTTVGGLVGGWVGARVG